MESIIGFGAFTDLVDFAEMPGLSLEEIGLRAAAGDAASLAVPPAQPGRSDRIARP